MHNLDFIDVISALDKEALVEKGRHYGDSWKKRGGAGAFMMLARKWDRLEKICQENNWDIFELLRKDSREEGILDDIRDLRRYLLLVESQICLEKYGTTPGPSNSTGMQNPRGFVVEEEI